MNKVYKINGLDCAHCAQKLEGLIKDIEGVVSSKITFVLQKLAITIEEDNSEKILKEVFKVVDDFGEGEITLKEI